MERSEDGRCAGRVSNLAPPAHKSKALRLKQLHWRNSCAVRFTASAENFGRGWSGGQYNLPGPGGLEEGPNMTYVFVFL